jgi:hypothetical protein
MTESGEQRRARGPGEPGEMAAAYSYCSLPVVPERVLGPEVDPHRASLIRSLDDKWVNGTVLHYYFFDQRTDGRKVFLSNGTSQWRAWTTNEREKDIVRRAFETWKDLGIGLEFEEVDSRDEAEIRIGFERGDGAWSYIGRQILEVGRDERTMNFGWDLTEPGEIDTAIHEIGHAIGFPHEHQNPNAGIVWDEPAVYAALAQPPNRWDRQTTFHNIIRKIDPDEVQGSVWDPNSIMHYPFSAHMIKRPEEYWEKGLTPAGGLSERDRTWVRNFYAPLEEELEELVPFKAAELAIAAGEQRDFTIRPTATRKYSISTFGTSDTVMVLFEADNDALRYLTGDDDSGESYNANLHVKLFKGREYVLRIRLYWRERAGETAVMMW